MRYVSEYATYQRAQGEEIQQRELQVMNKRNEMKMVLNEKGVLLKQHQQAQMKLESQEKEQQVLLNGLKKKQRGIQSEISRRRKEASALNARIDKLIAIEIVAAKRRAEEEVRRREKIRLEAEARRKAALVATSKESGSSSSNKKSSNDRTTTSSVLKKEEAPMETYVVDTEDKKLSNIFEQNRGSLPMPITGSYVIVSHYGQYNVAGLSNVKLDNKGIDIKGKAGAQARAIFNGEVSAVFQFSGLNNVIIRHGSYMSVYCNLSSVFVRKGTHVNTRQVIGNIHTDSSGNAILHFQLRKEISKLNPEVWLGR